jgi:hypothetical protein
MLTRRTESYGEHVNEQMDIFPARSRTARPLFSCTAERGERLAPRGLRAAATGVAAGWDWGPAVSPLASGCDLLVECRGLAAGRVGLRRRFG